VSGYHVAGDWGTSRLRLFRIEDGVVVDRVAGPGIANLAVSPAETLVAALSAWRSTGDPSAVRLCGMVGSRNGWVDVPYAECPADLSVWRAGAAQIDLDGLSVTIMPGLACTTPRGAPDVMRGEETQIFGAIAIDAALQDGRHLIALPGTHSKWAMVEDGRILGFQTFLTGELFALLRDHSILTRAAFPGARDDAAGEDEGFDAGLARSRDGALLGSLFEARSAQLRAGRSPAWALGFLSGLIIGSEIAGAASVFAAGHVGLVGDPKLTARYARALAAHDLATTRHDGDDCALAGLALLETMI
jgi:2-dehydro-3-deoxygalactonokinase